MLADFRSAWRALRAAPGFAAAAAATLALGIGLAAAMGTVARAVAFARLPVRDQDRVVVLWGAQPSIAHLPVGVPRDLRELAESGPRLREVAGVDFNGGWPVVARLGGPDAPPVPVVQGVVSGNFFDVLGTRAALGRTLRRDDDVVGAPMAAVLSDAAWRRLFGADPGVVGRTFTTLHDRRPRTVVGVMPPGLDYPRGVDYWVAQRPAWTASGLFDTTAIESDAIARLAPGATPGQAAGALTAFYRRAPARAGTIGAGTRGTARTLARAVAGDVRPAFTALAAAAGLVLLIACVNVVGLVLVRAERRRRELAVRAAVGAGRARLAGQLLAEHAVLAAAGGALGAALAAALVRAFAALAPADLPRVAEVRVDGWLVAAACAATAAVLLLVGVLPAFGVARRTDPGDLLRGAGRGGGAGVRAARGRRTLVGAQVALALVVLAGAGLLGRSFARLRAADLGVATDRLALVQLAPPPGAQRPGPEGADRWRAVLDPLMERVGALPGVRGVAPAASRPFAGTSGWLIRATPEGVGTGDTARAPWLTMEVTNAAYARTAGLALRRGRFLSDADRRGAPGAVVLSERAARVMWPDGDALGRRVRFGPERRPDWRTVVGVVADTRLGDLASPMPAVYLSYQQFGASPTLLLVRAAGEPAALLPGLRRAVAEAAPGVEVSGANTLRALAAPSLARPRLLSALLAAFALAAVALTAVGLFGVVATSVAERGRELGVRSALGARPADLGRLVVGEGLRVAAAGAAAGLAAALALGRLAAGLLYEVRPADPLALGGSAVALLAVCAAACLVPARRAARVDPASALRTN